MKRYPLLTPRSRKIEKCVARGSKKAIIDQCFKDPTTRIHLEKKLGSVLHSEVKAMCSDKVNSVLRSNNGSLKNFKWDKVMSEMKEHAPTLLNILLSCTRTKYSRKNRTAVVCFVAAILFQLRYYKMNLIQKIIGLILYAGHCGKKVCE